MAAICNSVTVLLQKRMYIKLSKVNINSIGNLRVSLRCWEHGGRIPPTTTTTRWDGGTLQNLMGGLSQYMRGAWGA